MILEKSRDGNHPSWPKAVSTSCIYVLETGTIEGGMLSSSSASLTGTVREGSHPHLPGGGPVVLAGERSYEVDRTFDRLFTTAARFFS